MKRTISLNKIFSIAVLVLIVGLVVSSCVKSRPGETDFSNTQPVVLIPEGGIQNFGADALTFPGTDSTDSTTFRINYAAKTAAPADEVVTIAIDPAALANYNAGSGIQYQLMPDSLFSFPATQQVTVKKGESYSDVLHLALVPYKIDPTQNYMLPISITAAPAGSLISQNFGTIYYHAIGNPLAGPYNWDWKRYNAADTTGALNPASFTGHHISAAPDDANTIEFQSGYGDQNGANVRYVVTFDNAADGGFINFKVKINPTDVTGFLTPNSIKLSNDASIIKIDSLGPKLYNFRFTYQVINSAMAPRTLIDYYYH